MIFLRSLCLCLLVRAIEVVVMAPMMLPDVWCVDGNSDSGIETFLLMLLIKIYADKLMGARKTPFIVSVGRGLRSIGRYLWLLMSESDLDKG